MTVSEVAACLRAHDKYLILLLGFPLRRIV